MARRRVVKELGDPLSIGIGGGRGRGYIVRGVPESAGHATMGPSQSLR